MIKSYSNDQDKIELSLGRDISLEGKLDVVSADNLEFKLEGWGSWHEQSKSLAFVINKLPTLTIRASHSFQEVAHIKECTFKYTSLSVVRNGEDLCINSPVKSWYT